MSTFFRTILDRHFEMYYIDGTKGDQAMRITTEIQDKTYEAIESIAKESQVHNGNISSVVRSALLAFLSPKCRNSDANSVDNP